MSADRTVVEQLVRKIAELARARVSEKVMEESIVEEIDRKFSEFVRRSLGGWGK